MAGALSDLERQLLRIAESEDRIAHLRSRIAQLKAANQPTEDDEVRLATLQDSLALKKDRLARLSAPTSYRCYLMTGDRIRGVRVVECADDAEAITKAAELLDAFLDHQNVEIWQGKRLVARVPRKP